jgi:predicted nucleic acid-binding protein
MTESVQRIVVDTGPLVAVLSRADQYQEWIRREFERLSPPVFTCEAVLSEAQLSADINTSLQDDKQIELLAEAAGCGMRALPNED